MSCDGLHLLNWHPATCKIVPFPTGKRVGKIRRTVEILKDRNGKGADQYWKQVIGGLYSQMKKSGLADDVIETELRAFADQVFPLVKGHPEGKVDL